jgi:radical SAM/Cys-rich protein
MAQVAAFLATRPGITLDITGGAPEMHPDFRLFVEMTAGLAGKRLLRSNLAIMAEPGFTWLPEFCREQDLTIVASLPCYLEENVTAQRGSGVFDKAIRVIRELNRLGYGNGLELDLVYNPGGPFLPPSQSDLEAAYRARLAGYGLTFSRLFTITNAPLGRFRQQLERKGRLADYQQLLQRSFNKEAAGGIMCRSLLSIDWQGKVYNCDFNQVLGMQATGRHGEPLTIFNLDDAAIGSLDILFADHCYCCTAGEGSSCTGALAA